MKKVFALIAAAVAVVAAFGLTACGEPEQMTIGFEAGSCVTVEITNGTGQDITAIAFKDSSEESFGDPLDQEAPLAADATASVIIPTPEALNDDPANMTDPLAQFTDLQITTADGMVYELHRLDIGDVSNATILINEDGMAHMTYTSLNNGNEYDTIETELLIIQEAEQAAAEAQAQAEAEAAAAAAAAAAAQPSASAATAGGGEDACVDDLVLN